LEKYFSGEERQEGFFAKTGQVPGENTYTGEENPGKQLPFAPLFS